MRLARLDEPAQDATAAQRRALHLYTATAPSAAQSNRRAAKSTASPGAFNRTRRTPTLSQRSRPTWNAIDGLIDIRGPQYSFRRNVKIESKSLDVDGDCLYCLQKQSRLPTSAMARSAPHRLPAILTTRTRVEAASIAALKIKSGIIYNEFGQRWHTESSAKTAKASAMCLRAT